MPMFYFFVSWSHFKKQILWGGFYTSRIELVQANVSSPNSILFFKKWRTFYSITSKCLEYKASPFKEYFGGLV